jgi:hypothetical protein
LPCDPALFTKGIREEVVMSKVIYRGFVDIRELPKSST